MTAALVVLFYGLVAIVGAASASAFLLGLGRPI